MANDDDKKPADEAAEKKKAKQKAEGQAKAKVKKSTEPAGPAPKYKREKPPRLKTAQQHDPAMVKEFNYKSVMQVPRILKISVNMGLGKAKDEPRKMIDFGVEELELITGQAPVVSRAKKNTPVFKSRKGQEIGVMVASAASACGSSSTVCSTSRCRASAFAACHARFDGRGNSPWA